MIDFIDWDVCERCGGNFISIQNKTCLRCREEEE